MATTFYLNNPTTTPTVDANTRGAVLGASGSDNFITSTATTAGGGVTQYLLNGTSAMCWITQPLAAATIPPTAFSISVSCTAQESSMSANVGGFIRIYRYRSGTLTLIAEGGDGVEYSTAGTVMSWTVDPVATTLLDNDRIVFRHYFAPIGTMGGGFSASLYVDSTSTVTFDTTLSLAPSGTTHNGVASMAGAGTLSAKPAPSAKLNGAGAMVVNTPRSALLSGAGAAVAVGTLIAALIPQDGAGYALGYQAVSDGNTTISKVKFTEKVTSILSVTLPDGVRYYAAGLSYAGGKTGYSVGGNSTLNTPTKVVDGIYMPTETTTNPAAVLSENRYGHFGLNAESNGYVSGGTGSTQTFEKFSFTTEAVSGIAATGSQVYGAYGVSSNAQGYFTLGTSGTGIDALAFGTETFVNVSSVFSTRRGDSAGFESHEAGYWAGGYYGTAQSMIEQISFQSDAVSLLSATLALSRYGGCGLSGLYKGVCAGGINGSGSAVTNIGGVDYVTNTADTFSTGFSIAQARQAGISAKTSSSFSVATPVARGAINVPSALYYAGGSGYMAGDTYSTPNTSVSRVAFTSETTSITGYALASYTTPGYSTESFGYFADGTTHYKLHLMTGAISSVSAATAQTFGARAWNHIAGYSNSNSTTNKYTFATNTQSSVASTMSVLRSNSTGVFDANYGYFCGGYTTVNISSIEKIAFSSDTYSTSAAALSVARYIGTGLSGPQNGIVAGGYNGTAYETKIDGVIFSTESSFNPGTALTTLRSEAGGMCSYTNGYVVGGDNTSSNYLTSIEKINLSTGARSAFATSLTPSTGRSGQAACYSRGGTFGFVSVSGSGSMVASATVVSGIQATMNGAGSATASATLASPVSIATADGNGSLACLATKYVPFPQISVTAYGALAASASPNYLHKGVATLAGTGAVTERSLNGSTLGVGYCINLWQATNYGYSEILSFNSETLYTSWAVLYPPVSGTVASGMQNTTFGYFVSGRGSVDAVGGIVFSTDTARSVAATVDISDAGYSSSPLAGYIAGGYKYSGALTNEVRKFVFSSESFTLLGGTLKAAREAMGSAGSATKGYYVGGSQSDTIPLSEIESVIYSTDTVGDPSASLPTAYKYQSRGCNSTTAGYFGGGSDYYSGVGGDTASIQKILFSTETTSTLSATILYADLIKIGLSASATGYFAGGDSGASSYIDRISFSTETAGQLTAQLTVASNNNAGLSYIPGANETHFGLGTASGSGALSVAKVTMNFGAKATAAGSGAVSATGSNAASVNGIASASGVGQATCSCVIVYVRFGVATMAAQGAVAITGTTILNSSATCASVGQVTASGRVYRTGASALAAYGAASASALLDIGGDVQMLGNAELTASASKFQYADAAMSVTGSMSAKAIAVWPRGEVLGLPTITVGENQPRLTVQAAIDVLFVSTEGRP